MFRHSCLTLVLLASLLSVVAPTHGDPPPGADDWKYDVVHRKEGLPLIGLVLEQTPSAVLMRCVSRRPGSPTVMIRESIPTREIDRVELLGPEEREKLQQRLKNLTKEREVLSAQLKQLDPTTQTTDPAGADQLTLAPVAWVDADRGPALTYKGTHFQLISNSREAVVQLVAIQLEQVYAAYARALPPRTQTGQPTVILVTCRMTDYQAIVRARGGNFLNPAFYDVEKNQIVCGTELERLADELKQTRKVHAKTLGEIEERRAELNELYKNKVPPELLLAFGEDQKRIKAREDLNVQLFQRARQRLFQRLYHEAFHAYLATFVFPPDEGEVPRWLNEGLAQVFETAIVEVGELRIGHVEKERLEAIRTAAIHGTLVPLSELLRSTEKDFLVAHAGEKQAADRMYLTSWGLAHYLSFDRKLLARPALTNYVRQIKRGTDPLDAFSELVGHPLGKFEKEFQEYLQRLRPDMKN